MYEIGNDQPVGWIDTRNGEILVNKGGESPDWSGVSDEEFEEYRTNILKSLESWEWGGKFPIRKAKRRTFFRRSGSKTEDVGPL